MQAAGAWRGGQLWTALTARAELIGAAVMRASSPEAIADLLNEAILSPPEAAEGPGVGREGRDAPPAFACTGSAIERFPSLARQHRVGPQARQTPPEVVCAARFGVAETGSVALDEPDADRAACFLAERLWVLVPEQDIVPTLDQAVQRLRDLVRGGSHHPLLMSGPSRTADIERTLTVGVHGPRAMVIVVVDAAAA